MSDPKEPSPTVADVLLLIRKVEHWDLGDLLVVAGAALTQYGQTMQGYDRNRNRGKQ